MPPHAQTLSAPKQEHERPSLRRPSATSTAALLRNAAAGIAACLGAALSAGAQEPPKPPLKAPSGVAVSVEEMRIRHLGRAPDQRWSVAESTSFRIRHNQERKLVDDACLAGERIRREVHGKWFGEEQEPWNAKCDVYLYRDRQELSRLTGIPASSPAHSEFALEHGRVIVRKMHLAADHPELLTALLPHEVTHAVFAGKFDGHHVPRWVDEAVAVLSEPGEKIEAQRRFLARSEHLWPPRQLMEMTDYPEQRWIPLFYAESVSLVDFLAREKDPKVFPVFVREGLRSGYPAALKKHYGFRNFEEFERHWKAHAFVQKER